MKLSDFDYDLPPHLIAQTPAAERASSRLLHLDGVSGVLRDLQPPDNGERDLVVVAAARLGRTRLIDNVEVLR